MITRKRSGALAAFLSLLVVSARPDSSEACGPTYPTITFVRSTGPDVTYEAYVGGALGVVSGTYGVAELAIAYRHLAGLSFDVSEREAVLESMRRRPYDDQREQRWFRARAAVARGDGGYLRRGFTGGDYAEVDNCAKDAFENAARTLEARVSELGATAPEVVRFVEAQDLVFRACARNEASQLARVPEAAPGSSARERADRAYQRAAQTFYLGRYDEALSAFESIANDQGSEWRELARYLVARVHVRLSYEPGNEEPELRRALSSIDQILANPRASSLHGAATRYRGHVLARLDRGARVRELALAIGAPHPGAALGLAISDLETLDAPEDFRGAGDDEPLRFFIEAMRTRDDAIASRAASLYASSGSKAFLVAALASATSPSSVPRERLDSLLEAARALAPSDPAFVTARVHRARLALEIAGMDRRAMHRELLAAREAIGSGLGVSATHAFTVLAFAFADTLAEATATLGASTTVFEERLRPGDELVTDPTLPGYDFHAYGARLLDALPLSTWVRLSKDTHLPEVARGDIATVGYVRALLANDASATRDFAPLMKRRFPENAALIEAVERARDPNERRYERIWLLLHSSALRAELDEGSKLEDVGFTSRASYFCPTETVSSTSGPLVEELAPALDRVVSNLAPASVAGSSRQAGSRAAVANAGPSGVFLPREAIAAVASRPNDPRNAELLSRAVRATRWACSGEGTRSASRDAYRLLHSRYRGSDEARAAPYFYGDR